MNIKKGHVRLKKSADKDRIFIHNILLITLLALVITLGITLSVNSWFRTNIKKDIRLSPEPTIIIGWEDNKVEIREHLFIDLTQNPDHLRASELLEELLVSSRDFGGPTIFLHEAFPFFDPYASRQQSLIVSEEKIREIFEDPGRMEEFDMFAPFMNEFVILSLDTSREIEVDQFVEECRVICAECAVFSPECADGFSNPVRSFMTSIGEQFFCCAPSEIPECSDRDHSETFYDYFTGGFYETTVYYDCHGTETFREEITSCYDGGEIIPGRATCDAEEPGEVICDLENQHSETINSMTNGILIEKIESIPNSDCVYEDHISYEVFCNPNSHISGMSEDVRSMGGNSHDCELNEGAEETNTEFGEVPDDDTPIEEWPLIIDVDGYSCSDTEPNQCFAGNCPALYSCQRGLDAQGADICKCALDKEVRNAVSPEGGLPDDDGPDQGDVICKVGGGGCANPGAFCRIGTKEGKCKPYKELVESKVTSTGSRTAGVPRRTERKYDVGCECDFNDGSGTSRNPSGRSGGESNDRGSSGERSDRGSVGESRETTPQNQEKIVKCGSSTCIAGDTCPANWKQTSKPGERCIKKNYFLGIDWLAVDEKGVCCKNPNPDSNNKPEAEGAEGASSGGATNGIQRQESNNQYSLGGGSNNVFTWAADFFSNVFGLSNDQKLSRGSLT